MLHIIIVNTWLSSNVKASSRRFIWVRTSVHFGHGLTSIAVFYSHTCKHSSTSWRWGALRSNIVSGTFSGFSLYDTCVALLWFIFVCRPIKCIHCARTVTYTCCSCLPSLSFTVLVSIYYAFWLNLYFSVFRTFCSSRGSAFF